jgi:hypothetical protein
VTKPNKAVELTAFQRPLRSRFQARLTASVPLYKTNHRYLVHLVTIKCPISDGDGWSFRQWIARRLDGIWILFFDELYLALSGGKEVIEMYALDSQRYLKWQTFPPGFRYWTKLWIDGFHGGTHIHWHLSPLSLIGLARVWRYFSTLEHWKPQQGALIRMACRRRDRSYNAQLMPPFDASRRQWDDFFSCLLEKEADDRKAIIDWHHERICEDGYFRDSQEVWHRINDLAGYLLAPGYSTDDLFNRVKDMVIDVQDIQEGTCTERMVLLFDRFRSPEPREYVVWTRVRSDTDWSKRLMNMFSRIFLESPGRLEGDRTVRAFLNVGSAIIPYVVIRLRGSHSVKERHRREALAMLDDTMRHAKPLGKMTLDAETQMLLIDEKHRSPWKYGRRRYALPMPLDEINTPEGLRVGHAAQDLFDNPERLLDEVFRAVEHSKRLEEINAAAPAGTKAWHILSQAYHWARGITKKCGKKEKAVSPRG